MVGLTSRAPVPVPTLTTPDPQRPLNASDNLAYRVTAEYREMPGLSLTLHQAERIFGLDRPTCRALLDALVETGFLRRRGDQSYLRSETTLAADRVARPRWLE